MKDHWMAYTGILFMICISMHNSMHKLKSSERKTEYQEDNEMKIAHITIQTEHFEKEIMFYETYTGMTVQKDMRPMGRNMVFLAEEKGDTEIEIIEKPGADYAGNDNLSIGFHADNIDVLRDQLAAEGFEVTPFITPAPNVRFFFVKDPAGVSVQFME